MSQFPEKPHHHQEKKKKKTEQANNVIETYIIKAMYN